MIEKNKVNFYFIKNFKIIFYILFIFQLIYVIIKLFFKVYYYSIKDSIDSGYNEYEKI